MHCSALNVSLALSGHAAALPTPIPLHVFKHGLPMSAGTILLGPCLKEDLHLQAVVVAHGDAVTFLATNSGAVLGSLRGCGAIRAPPTVDPWHGFAWVTGHAGYVAVLSTVGQEICRHDVGEPMSTSVTFAAGNPPPYSACCMGKC